jgi:chemotaxis protein CheX
MIAQDVATLRLEPMLDLNAAEPLRRALSELRGQAVNVDASQVSRLGGLCLQVLISARKTWAEDGRSFRLDGGSPEFTEQVSVFGNPELSFFSLPGES